VRDSINPVSIRCLGCDKPAPTLDGAPGLHIATDLVTEQGWAVLFFDGFTGHFCERDCLLNFLTGFDPEGENSNLLLNLQIKLSSIREACSAFEEKKNLPFANRAELEADIVKAAIDACRDMESGL